MITVHMIFNAHLDPVWLWPWQASLDELLATCRNACDRLDAHPDLVFTRGEAWVYKKVEELDPALFERIRTHVKAGRWEIVGGWWIQPDCNLPSGFAFEKQIEIGKRYLLDRFGSFPRIGYNVDSFGHAATIPGYLRAAGQDGYVMMRPQEHEMPLPARLFRWRGYEGGPEVTVFRIAQSYCHRVLSPDVIRGALQGLPPGVEHTMCFAGVGDHGGGPTEKQIQWRRENADAVPGCRIVFSSVSRFFDAIAKHIPDLPLVTGELQHHAVGCYTVHRAIKTGIRRAEHLLKQVEISRTILPGAETADLETAWGHVCFNQFHDTFGGTCLPSAYAQVDSQLGYARAVADGVLQCGLRRAMAALPPDRLQRIVLFNASDTDYDGFVECEPWMEGQPWRDGSALLDEDGQPIPWQRMGHEAITSGGLRLIFKTHVEAGKMRVLRMDPESRSQAPTAQVYAREERVSNNSGLALASGRIEFNAIGAALTPRLDLIEDPSDTWSHRLDRYAEGPVLSPVWERPCLVDAGPLMASMVQTGRIGESRLEAEWRIHADGPFVEMRLRVTWLETHKVLKMTLALPCAVERRVDGIMGGQLERANDGKERPIRDWVHVDLGGGRGMGVVCPDVFALDATPRRLRLTLLRSPIMAHHDPHPGTAARRTVSDQGVHDFRFRLFGAHGLKPEELDRHALMLQRPLLTADLTRGMPPS